MSVRSAIKRVRRPDGHRRPGRARRAARLPSCRRRSPAATPPRPRRADPWRAAPCGAPTGRRSRAALAGTHLIGQSPSSRNHDDGTRRRGDGVEPGGKLGRADHAAAELDDDRPRLPASGASSASARARLGPAMVSASLGAHDLDADGAGFLVELLDLHRDRAARGWARQWRATSSARVSTRLIWPRAMMSLMPLMIVS